MGASRLVWEWDLCGRLPSVGYGCHITSAIAAAATAAATAAAAAAAAARLHPCYSINLCNASSQECGCSDDLHCGPPSTRYELQGLQPIP